MCCIWLQVFSFKLRGAFNKMAKLSPEERARGVITSSAGNHAQGVALAASKLVRRAGGGVAWVSSSTLQVPHV
jgi:threonine dehydratase